jgi:hypothetical protein
MIFMIWPNNVLLWDLGDYSRALCKEARPMPQVGVHEDSAGTASNASRCFTSSSAMGPHQEGKDHTGADTRLPVGREPA